MKLSKLLSVGITAFMLTSSFTNALAKDTMQGSRAYNLAHGVENVLDRNNYCNTSCIAHQETIHFGKDLDQTLQMDARKLSILQGMENKIRGRGKNNGLVACVAGHTDSDASDAYNVNLSMRRARTVGKRMRAVGLARNIPIRAAGYGENTPIATNATKLGMAQNRRVVVQYGYNLRDNEYGRADCRIGERCYNKLGQYGTNTRGEFPYRQRGGGACILSGIGDRVARVPAATGGLGTGGKVALGVLAAGVIAAIIDDDGSDSTTGTTN